MIPFLRSHRKWVPLGFKYPQVFSHRVDDHDGTVRRSGKTVQAIRCLQLSCSTTCLLFACGVCLLGFGRKESVYCKVFLRNCPPRFSLFYICLAPLCSLCAFSVRAADPHPKGVDHHEGVRFESLFLDHNFSVFWTTLENCKIATCSLATPPHS